MITRLLFICALLCASAEAFAQPATACRCTNSSSTTVCSAGGYAPALSMLGRWKSGDSITYHLATADSDWMLPGPVGTGNLNPADVRNIVVQSANTWNNAPCCCTEWNGPGGTCSANSNANSKPTLQLVRAGPEAGTISVPANGVEPNYNVVGGVKDGQTLTQAEVIKRIWVSHVDYAGTAINFHDTPGTLAITLPAPFPTQAPNYAILRARMVINGSTFNNAPGSPTPTTNLHWFLTPTVPAACTPSNRCFSLKRTMTHEFGHFIGYNQSSCQLSVMIPTAPANDPSRTALHETDVKSLCALTTENGLTGNGYGKTEACGSTGSTGSSGTTTGSLKRYFNCAVDTDCPASLKCSVDKYCDIPCTLNTDCPSNEICPVTGNKFCTLNVGAAAATGASGVGGTGGDAALPSSDFCAPCVSNRDCAAAACVELNATTHICSTYCAAGDSCGSAATCSATTTGDGVCIPNDPSCVATAASRRGALNEVCDAQNPCGLSLICVQLPGSAVCLEYCDTDAARIDGKSCSNDGQACFELDKNLKFGACFKGNMREGESCLLPDSSVCGLDLKKQCTFLPGQTVDNSACYKLCDGTAATPCGEGQNCTLGASFGVCTPLPTQLCPLFDYGEKCLTGNDCASGFCTSHAGDQACSRTCTISTQSGCPQSFRCLEAGAGDKGFCWPANNMTKTPKDCTTKTSCGGCSSGGAASNETLMLAAFVFAIAWRRRSARGKR